MIALDTNILIYCCAQRDLRRQQTALDLVADTTDAVLPWDAMLVSACIEAGVSRLYSEDLPGHPNVETLEIVNPFA